MSAVQWRLQSKPVGDDVIGPVAGSDADIGASMTSTPFSRPAQHSDPSVSAALGRLRGRQRNPTASVCRRRPSWRSKSPTALSSPRPATGRPAAHRRRPAPGPARGGERDGRAAPRDGADRRGSRRGEAAGPQARKAPGGVLDVPEADDSCWGARPEKTGESNR